MNDSRPRTGRLSPPWGENAEADWAGHIDQIIVHGNAFHEEVVFFHRHTKTLILTDLIENFEPGKVPLWFHSLARLGGILYPNGSMPRDMRATFWRGRSELRDAVERMIAWEPQKIILAVALWSREGCNGSWQAERFTFVTQGFLPGDATEDARLTASDALLVLGMATNLVFPVPLVSDVDGDDDILVSDALCILRSVVGSTTLPCDPPRW